MASCGSYGNAAPADGGDCADCVQVVKTTKKVRVPCHRNTYKQYTVKVPRQVNEQVPRTVNYTEMGARSRWIESTKFRKGDRFSKPAFLKPKKPSSWPGQNLKT